MQEYLGFKRTHKYGSRDDRWKNLSEAELHISIGILRQWETIGKGKYLFTGDLESTIGNNQHVELTEIEN